MRQEMQFQNEFQMRSPVRKWLEMQGLDQRIEVPLPWGICDVVGASIHQGRAKKRLRLKQTTTIGSDLKFELLHRIPETNVSNAIHIDDLVQSFDGYITESQVVTSVAELAKKKFVLLTANNTVSKQNGWHPLTKKLIAVELKLTRFEEVLQQAISTKQLTSNSFAAMPRQIANRIARSDTARDSLRVNGIGLLAVSKTKCDQLIKPTASEIKVKLPAQMQCVERFWKTFIKDKTS